MAVAACLVLSACPAARTSQLPDPLRAYLDALIEGDHRAAYGRTALEQLSRISSDGETLSYGFFRAFHESDPLRSYAVGKVTKLDRRSIQGARSGGTAYYVVDLTLAHASGAMEQTISVDGDVLGVVEVDPVPVRIARSAPGAGASVDGVPLRVEPGVPQPGGTRTLLLLPGTHRLQVGTRTATIRTSPLEVVSGTAAVEDGVVRI